MAKTKTQAKKAKTTRKPASTTKKKPVAKSTTTKGTAKSTTAKEAAKSTATKYAGKSTEAKYDAKSKKPTKTDTADRRESKDRREPSDRREESAPVKVERRKLERRVKVSRRRQIDPTTCERDYDSDEIEFMSALDEYKRSSGRMFPTCSEMLEVIKKLGYEKRPKLEPDEQPAPTPASDEQQESNSQEAVAVMGTTIA